jgi:hypothetical protein
MSPEPQTPVSDDEAIRALVVRLARPRGGDGHVIERAAIMAAGSDSAAIEAWILAHDGSPEPTEPIESTSSSGLHGHRIQASPGQGRAPRRFLIPVGVL